MEPRLIGNSFLWQLPFVLAKRPYILSSSSSSSSSLSLTLSSSSSLSLSLCQCATFAILCHEVLTVLLFPFPYRGLAKSLEMAIHQSHEITVDCLPNLSTPSRTFSLCYLKNTPTSIQSLVHTKQRNSSSFLFLPDQFPFNNYSPKTRRILSTKIHPVPLFYRFRGLPQMSSSSQTEQRQFGEKQISVNRPDLLAIIVTTAFTILNSLEHEF